MKIIISLILLFFFHQFLWAQANFTLSGTISDIKNGSKLIGAQVMNLSTSGGSTTDQEGFYQIKLKDTTNILVFSYLSYQTDTLRIKLTQDNFYDHFMYAKSNMLNEVIISNDRNKIFKRLGIQHFNQEDISANPVVFGEADIIKLIQRQPGVKNISDGSSALYVNGGKADQNLLLLDGLLIDNPGHLMGMVSSFNSFAIKDIQFYPSYMGPL